MAALKIGGVRFASRVDYHTPAPHPHHSSLTDDGIRVRMYNASLHDDAPTLLRALCLQPEMRRIWWEEEEFCEALCRANSHNIVQDVYYSSLSVKRPQWVYETIILRRIWELHTNLEGTLFLVKTECPSLIGECIAAVIGKVVKDTGNQFYKYLIVGRVLNQQPSLTDNEITILMIRAIYTENDAYFCLLRQLATCGAINAPPTQPHHHRLSLQGQALRDSHLKLDPLVLGTVLYCALRSNYEHLFQFEAEGFKLVELPVRVETDFLGRMRYLLFTTMAGADSCLFSISIDMVRYSNLPHFNFPHIVLTRQNNEILFAWRRSLYHDIESLEKHFPVQGFSKRVACFE